MGYSPQHSPESTQDPLPVIAPASTDFQRVPEARVENSIPDDLFLSPTSVTESLESLLGAGDLFSSADWSEWPWIYDGMLIGVDPVVEGATNLPTGNEPTDLGQITPTSSRDVVLAHTYAMPARSELAVRESQEAEHNSFQRLSERTEPSLQPVSDIEIQHTVIESHIEFATMTDRDPGKPDQRARIQARHDGSRKVENAFGLEGHGSNPGLKSRHILDQFVSLFFEHFHPQCPVFWEQGFDSYAISPTLFLSMVSIGAMYAGEKAARYGRMLHDRLRSHYAKTVVQDSDEGKMTVFLLFGFLTLGAELLLGQDPTFSHAHHINSILVSQCRRLNLFNDRYVPSQHFSNYRPHVNCSDARLMEWIEANMPMKRGPTRAMIGNEGHWKQAMG
ncbi:hypothetical protein SAPIO_CDS6734 [Scedosporium apiospermum]|uniref:Transcription factor domain-containing protein n=1 Tax=Pseudallescheria apiosperma TaxID=563466 RepID=A0A084G347_PSEDA|nr:uncharacterized protein SAPIO_CDS6734 [Scedosporium apiospermum]KEZ41759.1 hypothetical protein SAPIO_CDS6734 [Scedosporium apiospermum]